jgi:hypothetical protein
MIPDFKALTAGLVTQMEALNRDRFPVERAIRNAYCDGLNEAIGLMHMVKSEVYDGENLMTKHLCVGLEHAIRERIQEILE